MLSHLDCTQCGCIVCRTHHIASLVLRSIGSLTPLKQSYVVSLGCRVFIIKPSLGSYSLMLVPPERSYAISSALKACAKSEGSRWTVVAGESNSKRGKTSSVKTLSSVGDVLSFMRCIRTLKQTCGISGRFNTSQLK